MVHATVGALNVGTVLALNICSFDPHCYIAHVSFGAGLSPNAESLQLFPNDGREVVVTPVVLGVPTSVEIPMLALISVPAVKSLLMIIIINEIVVQYITLQNV